MAWGLQESHLNFEFCFRLLHLSVMRFVVVTRDYAGLGFAIRLKDEGHSVLLATNISEEDSLDPGRQKHYQLVGQGMVDKAHLSDLMARREEMRDWYWVWDFNHAVEENETLRNEGFKVLCGGRHANTMEHDRQACLEFAATYGLESPHRFDSEMQATRYASAKRIQTPRMSTSRIKALISKHSFPNPKNRPMPTSNCECIWSR